MPVPSARTRESKVVSTVFEAPGALNDLTLSTSLTRSSSSRVSLECADVPSSGGMSADKTWSRRRAEDDIVGRGYEDNKSSTDHVGFNGIAQSSASTGSGPLWE
jgi:hypothetical protein